MSAHLLLVSESAPRRRYAATASQRWPICRVWAPIAATTHRCSLASRRCEGCRARAAAGIVEVALDTIADGAPVSLMPYLAPMAELVPGSGASATELVIGVLLERAANTIEILLRSDDPLDAPTIEYHSLESTVDRARLRGAVEICAVDPRSARRCATSARAAQRLDRRRSRRWIRENITTAVHLCASAPMGPDTDPLAVVDQYCRVRGVERLRVVDTSVLPTAPSAWPRGHSHLDRERASAFFDGVSS